MFEIKPAEDQPDLVIAELLGVINNMANTVKRHEDAFKGLEAVIKEYQAMVHALREQGGRLVDQRDRARSVATMLEAECANCWGPIHQFGIKEARFQAAYQYPVDPFLTDEDAEDGA
jgi:UDP-N-acetylmuramate-alanine ligase